MRYENPLYMAEDAGSADLISGGRLQLGISRGSPEQVVEGFKHCDLLKIEVWRASSGKPARYMNDDFIVAIATDSPELMPEATLRPVLDLDDAEALADYLLNNQERFHYSFQGRSD